MPLSRGGDILDQAARSAAPQRHAPAVVPFEPFARGELQSVVLGLDSQVRYGQLDVGMIGFESVRVCLTIVSPHSRLSRAAESRIVASKSLRICSSAAFFPLSSSDCGPPCCCNWFALAARIAANSGSAMCTCRVFDCTWIVQMPVNS